MLDDVIRQFRRRLNLETGIGYLGDGSGEVHNRARPGYYYVRFRQANSTYTAPISLRAHPNANLPDMDGLAVVIGYDPSGDQIILEVFSPGVDAAGINPLALNPLDSSTTKLKPQSDSLPSFLCTQHADRTNKPLYVVVFPGFIVTSTNLVYFPGAELNLASLVPSAGQHRYVVICLKNDYATLEALGSTIKDLDDPLSDDDIEEAYLTRTSGSIAIWAWELRDAQTVLDSDPTKQVDLRQLVGSFAGVTDHGYLNGLTDDDHTQYVLLSPTSSARNVIQPTGAAIIPLTIKGAASQSASLQQWQDSTGAVLASLSPAGKLMLVDALDVGNTGYATSAGAIVANSLGIGSAPTTLVFANLVRTTTDASASAHYMAQAVLTATAGANTSGQYGGGNFEARVNDGFNYTSASALIGIQALVRHLGAGTVTGARTLNLGGPVVSGGGVVTTWEGARIGGGASVTGGSSVGTAIAVSIPDITFAGTNYALQTNAGNVVFNEGGHATTVIRGEGDNDQNLFCTVPGTDRFGIGTATASTKAHVLLTDAGTAAVVNVVTIGHDSSGTPAAGFGTGLIFEGESSTTASQSMGRITSEYVVATHASRTTRMKFTAFDASGEREGIRIEASGSAPLLGFFGVNAVVRPTALTAQLTTITHTAPGTPDYAIQDLTQTTPYGFVTKDEGNTLLSVVANLQTRMGEMESKTQGLGLLN